MTVKELKVLSNKALVEEMERAAFNVCKRNDSAASNEQLNRVEEEILRRLEKG